MKFLALIALVFSLNAHATGGFDCTGVKSNGEQVSISGATGRVVGNPLISPVLMTVGNQEINQVFPRAQVVGYWNIGRYLSLAIIDSNAEKMLVKLEAKFKKRSNIAKGKLILADGEKVKVTCEAE